MSRTYRGKQTKTKHGNRRFRELDMEPPNGGPGGWDCACCGERRGKKRDRLFRAARRKDKQRMWEEER